MNVAVARHCERPVFAVRRFVDAMLLYHWWPPFDFVRGPTNEACSVLFAAESARGVCCEWLRESASRTIGILDARLFLCKNARQDAKELQ